jgi:hypothetical protein
MKKIAPILGLTLFTSTVFTGTVIHAHDDSVESLGGGGPCKRDIEMLCKGVEPGEGRILACLRRNSDAISAECKAKIEQRREARKEKRKEMRKLRSKERREQHKIQERAKQSSTP